MIRMIANVLQFQHAHEASTSLLQLKMASVLREKLECRTFLQFSSICISFESFELLVSSSQTVPIYSAQLSHLESKITTLSRTLLHREDCEGCFKLKNLI